MRSILFALVVVMLLIGSVVLADSNGTAPTGAIVMGGPTRIDCGVGTPTSLSPDRTKMLVRVFDTATDDWAITMYDRRSETSVLVATHAYGGVWSPDGTKCAYWIPFRMVNGEVLSSLAIKVMRTGVEYRVNAYTADKWRRLEWSRNDLILFSMVRKGRSALAEFSISAHQTDQITPWGTIYQYMDPFFQGGYYYYSGSEGFVQIGVGGVRGDQVIWAKQIIVKSFSEDLVRNGCFSTGGPVYNDNKAIYCLYYGILRYVVVGSDPIFFSDMIAYAGTDGHWYIDVYQFDIGKG